MTMDCVEFRRETGADPGHLGPEATAHRDACPACAESLRRTLELDEKIFAALTVPAPSRARSGRAAVSLDPDDLRRREASQPGRVIRFPVIERRRWMALAASIVGGVMVGSLLWIGGPRASLARDVVEHMGHEPGAMVATASAADPAEVEAVLERAGVRLQSGIGTVSYASTCPFRGEKVPHLVVQTTAGPMTVMVLRHDRTAEPMEFDEGGYAGTIVPAGPGSIAVIGHAPAADLEQVAGQVRSAIQWK
jgi:hypothetical protein